MGIESQDNTEASADAEMKKVTPLPYTMSETVRQWMQGFEYGRRNHGPCEPSHYFMEGYHDDD